ncbi:coat protein [Blackberry virus A]|uniref:Coat protein n=1 Tax=Blackberry virus A TaxID=2185086 RepID=A0A2S1YE88_9VIRU|nr:coat protein [Blackberry virus A]AWK02342.1 coat protein [Blackberry virus A]AXE72377.1 coat protein [Blackberry virus A]AXE72387.1 coat protein [Blackberry virus A]AXE72393.1 coat protein [Blackberry virus A]
MNGKAVREAVITLMSVKAPGVLVDPKSDEERELSNNTIANIFGNIAIYGTSSKVSSYPISVRCFDLSVGRLKEDKLKGADLKIAEIVISMLTISKAASEPPLAGITLRQMCEPFATDAYLFLKVAANSNIYSNLARKMTRSGNKEPQVLFDFAKGLPINKLTRSEASAIQVMHQRLFRTEGAKGVFDAQSNVGENSVEL